MGLLADIYSASDSLKRRVKGLFADPAGYMQQAAGLLSDDALKQAEINKRMVHNPETITRADTAGLLGTVMNFAPMGMTKAAPRAEAFRIAQKNAAKPVSEGGLGLRPDNTAMERAKAMGFDTDRFHGTKGDKEWKGIDEFKLELANNGLYGEGVYTTSSPKIAGGGKGNSVAPQGYATNEALNTLLAKEQEAYAELQQVTKTLEDAKKSGDPDKIKMFQDWADGLQQDIKGYGEWKTGGGAVYPLMVSNPNPFNPDKMRFKRGELPVELRKQIEDSLLDMGKNPKGKWPMSYGLFSDALGGEVAANKTLQGLGYSGIQHAGGAVTGVPIKHTVDMLFNPNQVRSRFAAFDPARRHEADLLGQVNPELLPYLIGGGLLGGYGVSQADKSP